MPKRTPALDYPPVRAYVGKLPGYPCDKCTSSRNNKAGGCNTICPVWAVWFAQTWREMQKKFKISSNEEN